MNVCPPPSCGDREPCGPTAQSSCRLLGPIPLLASTISSALGQAAPHRNTSGQTVPVGGGPRFLPISQQSTVLSTHPLCVLVLLFVGAAQLIFPHVQCATNSESANAFKTSNNLTGVESPNHLFPAKVYCFCPNHTIAHCVHPSPRVLWGADPDCAHTKIGPPTTNGATESLILGIFLGNSAICNASGGGGSQLAGYFL